MKNEEGNVNQLGDEESRDSWEIRSLEREKRDWTNMKDKKLKKG